MESILEYLNKHGEKMDIDIADATGLSILAVKAKLLQLSLNRAVINCNVTKYIDGVRIDGISSRISGSVPQASPGRKPKTEVALES